jgi:hypothetical protein
VFILLVAVWVASIFVANAVCVGVIVTVCTGISVSVTVACASVTAIVGICVGVLIGSSFVGVGTLLSAFTTDLVDVIGNNGTINTHITNNMKCFMKIPFTQIS